MNDNNKETQKRKIMLVQERSRYMMKKTTEMRRISRTSLRREKVPAGGSTTQFHTSDVLELPPTAKPVKLENASIFELVKPW